MASIDIAALIDDAVDANVNEPNWDLNTLLSDCVNENDDLCDQAFRKIEMTLQGAVAKSVLHALRLLGFFVEKGSNRVLSLAGRRPFLGSIVALTDGTKGVEVQSKSLLLIRQWGEQYKDSENKNFHDTLSMLQRQGIQFPEFGDEDVKASAQVENKLSDSCSRDPSDTRHGEFRQELTKRERQIAKLQADLANVMEKMTTVNELLENADPKDDEQLENLYEFLRQCRPRMNALIEGGLQGRISEELLEECLNVNDSLTRLLEIAQRSGLSRS